MIKPGEVASELQWDIGLLRQFVGEALEAANDHVTAAAIWALNAGDYKLAKDFIDFEEALSKAGELTPGLREREVKLRERLKRAEGR